MRRYEEARKFFEGYAAKSPRDADAAMYLGRTYLALRKTDPAVDWLEKAAALAPASSEKQWWLGRGYGAAALQANLLSAAGLAKKTKAAFDKAVALDPANLDARDDLILFYLQAPGFMGGSVDIHSIVGEGTTVRIRVPLKPQHGLFDEALRA